MGRKILLIAASVFLIWQSFNLIGSLHIMGSLGAGLSFFIAFLINLYITGIFAFSGFALPTQKLLPDSYYQVKHPQRIIWYYDFFKVSYFRKFLLATVWRSKQQQKKYFDGKRAGLENLVTQSQKSEFGHLLPAITIAGVIIYLFILGLVKAGIMALLINIIGNIYPVILQRHHRMRIERLRIRYKD
jgi:hypothetical protein